MNLHLYHAVTHATSAIAELSGISFYDKECSAPELCEASIRSARDHLAKAAAQLNAYDAKRSVKAETV